MSDTTTATAGGQIVDNIVSNLPTEVKICTWEIKDFLAVLERSHLLNPSIEFEAGASIFGQPTKWRLILKKKSEDGYCVGIYLGLVTDPGPEFANAFVKYDISIKKACGKTVCLLEPVTKDITELGSPRGVMCTIEHIKQCLVNDAMTIHLKLVVFGPKLLNSEEGGSTRNTSEQKMVENSRQDLSNTLRSLLKSGINSDFVIRVMKSDDQYSEINVHKAILGARSHVFQAMFESQMKEQASGVMIIEDLSLDCVNLLLQWIYTGSLDDGWKKVAAEMVRAADKYRLPLLLEFLDKRLHWACDVENGMNLVKVAKLHGLTTATKNITEFIRANLEKML